ncbi:expressed protein [Chlorella variabilis]|uniref:Expressed protein n=1 Tax=Chlorella variabilis TaxID=554065 RepID=E1ZI06_CHLVA|nr:expressed protein [Chlorella variabilis]EFN54699.1 expressed protein [Chlorella variabilis]|eukprot:XP_005846801.1 expressed protein [Chlorella variabilis]
MPSPSLSQGAAAPRRMVEPAAPGCGQLPPHESEMPTKGSAAPAACLPAPAPAAAAALPAPWPASDSPAVQPQPPRLSPGSGHGARPITPDPAPAQAAATPDASRAASAGAGAAAGAAARQARAREQREQERWCRVESFVRHVTTSPLIHSALCSLLDGVSGEADGETDGEADGEADAELPHGDTLQLALAQMLALFLRAGYPTASDEALLTCLWVLESFGNVWRSPAGPRISAYVHNLCYFAPELALYVNRNWRERYINMRAALVEGQRELLSRVEWRVRLDLHSDVRPCYHWLFRNPAAWGRLAGRLSPEDAGRAAAAPGAIPAPPAAARDGWPASLRALCNRVESRRPVAEPGVPQGAEEFAALSTLWPKRQRTQL